MSEIAIRFENVSKRYRLGSGQKSLREALTAWPRRLLGRGDGQAASQEIWALKDVSFEVQKGEALGIIGPNGAGKTTILKLLAGVTRPTAGRIEVHGKLSALIELGAGFHPDLTGRENIYLNGAILGLKKREIDALLDEIVAFAELERFIDTPVKRYSSGMYVRLGFAVAAHVNPDILLIDEVLAVGDMSFQRKSAQRIGHLKSSNVIIVFVSHNLESVRGICDRAILLLEGQLRWSGTVDEAIKLYQQYNQNTIRSLARPEIETANLYQFRPRDGGSDVEIINVRFVDFNGQSRDSFTVGETMIAEAIGAGPMAESPVR